MSNFSKRYPDFASIEYKIRQAHAERSVAIAAALADAILGAVRGVRRLVAPAARTAPVAVKAPVARKPARA